MRGDQEAAVGTGSCREVSAEESDAFAHADQPVAAGRVLSRWPHSAVGHLEIEVALPGPESDERVVGPGVPQGVGEGFLDDSIDRQADPFVKDRRFAVDLKADREADRTEGGRQFRQFGQAGEGRCGAA